ncbi:hypothetical protein ScPMuIL_009560 [Solemya velum]
MADSEVRMHILISQDHSACLLNHFYMLYQKKELCDVLLVTQDGTQLGCHKIVLVACSGHFQTLIVKGGTATKMQVILDVPPWCLRVLLEFMYTGQLIVKAGIELELLKVARHLKIDKVVELLHSTFDLTTPAATPVKLIAKNVCNIQIKAEPGAENSSDDTTVADANEGNGPLSRTMVENDLVLPTRTPEAICLSPSSAKAPSPLKKLPQNVEELKAKKQLDFSPSPLEIPPSPLFVKNSNKTDSTSHVTQTVLPPAPLNENNTIVNSVATPITQPIAPVSKPKASLAEKKYSLTPSVDENGVQTGFLLKAVTVEKPGNTKPADSHGIQTSLATVVPEKKSNSARPMDGSQKVGTVPLPAAATKQNNSKHKVHGLITPKGISLLGPAANKPSTVKHLELEACASQLAVVPTIEKNAGETKPKDGHVLGTGVYEKKYKISDSVRGQQIEKSLSPATLKKISERKPKASHESGAALPSKVVSEKKFKNADSHAGHKIGTGLSPRIEKKSEVRGVKDGHESASPTVPVIKVVDGQNTRSLSGKDSKQIKSIIDSHRAARNKSNKQESSNSQTNQTENITRQELLMSIIYQPTVRLERLKLPCSLKKSKDSTISMLTTQKEPLPLQNTITISSQLATAVNQGSTVDDDKDNTSKEIGTVVSKSGLKKQRRGSKQSPRMTVTLEKALSATQPLGRKKQKTQFSLSESASIPNVTSVSPPEKHLAIATKKIEDDHIATPSVEASFSVKTKRSQFLRTTMKSSLPFKKRNMDRLNSDEYAKNLQLVRVTPKKQKLDDSTPSKQETSKKLDTDVGEMEVSYQDNCNDTYEDDCEEVLPTLKVMPKETKTKKSASKISIKRGIGMRGTPIRNTKVKKAKNGRVLMKMKKSQHSPPCEKCGIQFSNAFLMKQHSLWLHSLDQSVVYLANMISRKRIAQSMMMKGCRTIKHRKKGQRKTFCCKICKLKFTFYSTWSLHWTKKHGSKRKKSVKKALMKYLQWKDLVMKDKFPKDMTEPSPPVEVSKDEPTIVVLYKCMICLKTFILEQLLAEHVMAAHNMSIQLTNDRVRNDLMAANNISFQTKPDQARKEMTDVHSMSFGNTQEPERKDVKVDTKTVVRNAYHCRMCKLDLFSQIELSRHHEEIHGIYTGRKKMDKVNIECEIPGCTFSSRNLTIMNTHFKEKHPSVMHLCGICGMTFRLKVQFDHHTYIKHGSGRINYCELCDVTFSRATQFHKHKVRFHEAEHKVSQLDNKFQVVKPSKVPDTHEKVSTATSSKLYKTSSKRKSPKKAPMADKPMKNRSQKVKKSKVDKQGSKKSKSKSPRKAKKNNNLSFVSRSTGNHLSKPNFFDEQEQAVLLIQRENESDNGSDISYIIEVVEEDSNYDSIVQLDFPEVSAIMDRHTTEQASLDSASTASSTVSPPVVCTPVFSLRNTTPVLQNTPNSEIEYEVSSSKEKQIEGPGNPNNDLQTAIQSIQNTRNQNDVQTTIQSIQNTRNQNNDVHTTIQSIQNTRNQNKDVQTTIQSIQNTRIQNNVVQTAIESIQNTRNQNNNVQAGIQSIQNTETVKESIKIIENPKALKPQSEKVATQMPMSVSPERKMSKSSDKHKKPKIMKVCNVCGYQTHVDHFFESHLKTHQQFSCDFCNFRFVQEEKLKRHIRVHHPVSEEEKTNNLCAFCGQCFQSQKLLAKHEKKHEEDVKKETDITTNPNFVVTESPKKTLYKKFKKDGTFVCKTCNYRTIHLNNFRRHLRTHGAEKFQCPKCEKAYTEKEKLNKHIRIVHDNNPLLCDICGKGFHSREGLMYHVEGHMTNRKPRKSEYLDSYRTPTGFLCDICGYKSNFSNNFRRHLTIHSQKLDCPHCHLLFTTDRILQRHIEKSHNTPCLCTTCGLVMKSEKQLQKHMKMQHGNDQLRMVKQTNMGETVFVPNIDGLTPKQEVASSDKTNSVDEVEYCCATCGYQTKKARQYMKHEKMHARGMLSCKACNKTYLDAKDLATHFKMEHGQNYQCPQCPQVLKTQHSLQRHIWKHKTSTNKSFNFSCSHCSYKTNLSNNFRRHQKVHTGERFKCSLCGSIYSELFKLRNHVKLAHVQPLICKMCGKTYTSKKGYQDHMNIKHGNPKKYKCQYCKKVFMYFYNYKSHLNTHEKSVFYRCGKCGKDSLWRSSLMSHMKKCTVSEDTVKTEKE